MTTITKIQHRRDTAINWSFNNPTPYEGELCFETDTGRAKIGTGVDAYTALPYLDSTLTDTDISNMGYIKVDTNTQLTDAEIAAMGYIKVDTNTQLTDTDISNMGYIKVDTNTQLTDTDISNMGYIKTSGDLLGLSDTPVAYGTAGQVIAVDSAGTGLEFVNAAVGGAGGASTILDLTDTPSTYGGAGMTLQYTGSSLAPLDWMPMTFENLVDVESFGGLSNDNGKVLTITSEPGPVAVWEYPKPKAQFIQPFSFIEFDLSEGATVFTGQLIDNNFDGIAILTGSEGGAIGSIGWGAAGAINHPYKFTAYLTITNACSVPVPQPGFSMPNNDGAGMPHASTRLYAGISTAPLDLSVGQPGDIFIWDFETADGINWFITAKSLINADGNAGAIQVTPF